ncbi:MAG: ATP-binding protein [Coriobacteriales bacterium]|jgi:AAA+ ATPase superfamily predicted ATPase|nr:ATP-binding protein [Coriobacteriales bacterium]
MNLIGRKNEIRELRRFHASDQPELIVVYGRRRVGKTFLVKELFGNDFAFYFTGTIGVSDAVHLANFDEAIVEYGGTDAPASASWHDAFRKLRLLLSSQDEGRKTVFIDEMPWLDVSGSDFLTAFDYFWNSWASAVPEILLILCGSSTSWITKKLFHNRGGLHNRVTGRMYLAPFTLGECEEFFKSRGIEITRYQMLESYMVFGGIPFYLHMFDKGLSFSQNVDRLCFSNVAPLRDEYRELYCSLFSRPQRHMRIVESLAGSTDGMTRNEVATLSGLAANGRLTEALSELEQCDFVERYTDFTRLKNGAYYYLKDPFTLFYLRYMKDNNTKDEYFWTNYGEDGGHRAWNGYAFELVCRGHLKQLKQSLGISGVSTSTSSWRSKETEPGAQIDLVISRRDGVINLCEMKYTKHPYTIGKAEAEALERKKAAFAVETGTRSALHITMVTTYGLERKGYFGLAQSQITMDDLFL